MVKFEIGKLHQYVKVEGYTCDSLELSILYRYILLSSFHALVSYIIVFMLLYHLFPLSPLSTFESTNSFLLSRIQ